MQAQRGSAFLSQCLKYNIGIILRTVVVEVAQLLQSVTGTCTSGLQSKFPLNTHLLGSFSPYR